MTRSSFEAALGINRYSQVFYTLLTGVKSPPFRGGAVPIKPGRNSSVTQGEEEIPWINFRGLGFCIGSGCCR